MAILGCNRDERSTIRNKTTHLRRIFTSYDVDDSGTVEVDELRDAFALHGKYSEEEMNQIFLAVTKN